MATQTATRRQRTRPIRHADVKDVSESMLQEGAFVMDVRGFDEFATGHVPGSVCIPLPDLERRAGEIPTNGAIYVICAAGGRSEMAAERLAALGFSGVVNVQGGMKTWSKQGLPMECQRSIMPLDRQARGIAGVLVVVASLVAASGHSEWAYGSALIGMGLLVSCLTGFCPMVIVLKLMPWNRVPA